MSGTESGGSESHRLQHRVVELGNAVRKIDLRDYEDVSSTILVTSLIPRFQGIMDKALELLNEVATSTEEVAGDSISTDSGFFRTVDALVLEPSHQSALADLAFMGSFELRAKSERLRGVVDTIPSAPAWRTSDHPVDCPDAPELLSWVASARRKLLKVLSAFESLLCSEAGLEPRLDFQTELVTSLAVRRAYAKLRYAILNDNGTQPEEVRLRLQRSCTAIARLRGRDVYFHLRYADRQQLRSLQERILALIGEREADPVNGLRLCQDIAAFVGLLASVNLRSELIEHDREVITRIYEKLFLNNPQPGRISSEIAEELASLYGLDESLDQMISDVSGESELPENWRLPLSRLRNQFHQSEQTMESGVTAPESLLVLHTG